MAEETARVRERVRFGACATVAPGSALFGMLRMFEVFAENHFRITSMFHRREKAEEWLMAQIEPAPQVRSRFRGGDAS